MNSTGDTNLIIELVSHTDKKTIEQLIELGNLARDTLGLLRRAIYYDAASNACLLAARYEPGADPVGYVLFRLPRDEIVLTHVCVDANHRRSSIAAQLIDEVSQRHRARQGVRAKCKDSYANIQTIWQRLGFTARGPAVGRGKDQAPMTVWWRDHGHPNLFTPPLDEPTIVATAIDTNILMDLHTRSQQTRADRSQALLAPDLMDRIELVVPYGLERDLARQPAERRQRLIAAADRYRRPKSTPGRAQDLFDIMITAIKHERPEYPVTPQDTGDMWQLAETAAAGIQVFLTWDDRLRHDIAPIVNRISGCPELSQLRVLDPDHLVIRLDELAHAAAYRPDTLEGTDFSTAPAGSDSEAVLMSFLDVNGGESKTQLRARLRTLARTQQFHSIVNAPDNTAVACYAATLDGAVLHVPLLRLAHHEIAETLGRRLLWRLRQHARQLGASVVEISDPYMSGLLARIASHEHYRRVDTRWYAFVIDRIGTAQQISAAATQAYRQVDLPPAPLVSPMMPPSAASYYERAWWPAKITDSAMLHFAVAIRPEWSAELFGVPATLTARPTQLALGREQVYYRTGHKSVLQVPGRILWYMSKGSRTGPGRFIGTSLLDAIDLDTPTELHTALGHYGVFRLDDIETAARNGMAQALHLSDIELFPHDVTWRTYLDLSARLGGPKMIFAPVKVPVELFNAVYELGYQRTPLSQ